MLLATLLLTLAAGGREEALRRRVRADDECHVDEARQDVRARRRDCLGPARAGAVGARDRDAGPAEGLREGRARDEARIAVPDRLSARDELDVLPLESRVVEVMTARIPSDSIQSSRLQPIV